MSYRIVEKKTLNPTVFLMEIEAPLVAKKAEPGQFIILRIDEKGERVPFTIADYDREKGTVTIIVQIVGKTTRDLSELESGDDILDFAGPLGQPTPLENKKKVAVIGGGLGTAIAYPQAKKLHRLGTEVTVITGFRNKDLIILEDELKEIADKLIITTDDGSNGTKGFVTDVVREKSLSDCDYFYACGPLPMLRAVCGGLEMSGEVSLDERMACGFGVCMCCSIETKSGAKRICKEGPVFPKEELIWK